jgi:putative endonuclease
MGIKKGFTFKYGVNRLVYFETFQNIEEAIEREKKIKKWNRSWKIELIEKESVKCLDLASDWCHNLLID